MTTFSVNPAPQSILKSNSSGHHQALIRDKRSTKIRYFGSTFIAFRYNYMINKEYIKGEEVELAGSKIRYNMICGFQSSFGDFISSTVFHLKT